MTQKQRDAKIVAALEAAVARQESNDAEAVSLLAARSPAEVAAATVERAKAGQVTAIRALADADELGRLEG